MVLDLKDHYEEIGKEYKSKYEKYFHFIEKGLVGVPKNGKILDVGCADGDLLLSLKNMNYQPYGVDIANSFVERAIKNGCVAFQASSESLPFEANFFDCVISTETLEHVERPFETLQEFHRIIKTGGFCLVSTPNAGYLVRIFSPNLIVPTEIVNHHINIFDITQYQIIFGLIGFKLLWYSGFGDIFPRWKGFGRILDRIFHKIFPFSRSKQYLFLVAQKL